mmetsp:Transcript_22197/g.54797  ORF Transcript_22197/g.54797 Transcript_22197/m.54797 type:complete len:238 (-) Transcript_22197:202-915(-)
MLFHSRASVAGFSSATGVRVSTSRMATRPDMPPTATSRAPTAAIEVGPSSGTSAGESPTASTSLLDNPTKIDSLDPPRDRDVPATPALAAECGICKRYRVPALSITTTDATASPAAYPGPVAVEGGVSTMHAMGSSVRGNTTRTQCDRAPLEPGAPPPPPPPKDVSDRTRADASSARMAQVRRIRPPDRDSSAPPPPTSDPRVALFRSLAPTTSTVFAGACSSSSTSEKPIVTVRVA